MVTPVDKRKPLSYRQRAFVEHLRKDPKRIGTTAAINAGYSVRGADVAAVRLLADDRIRALIEEADTAALDALKTTGDKVLVEMAYLAHSDILEVFNDDGTLKHPSAMTPKVRAAIKSIKFEELWEGDKSDSSDGESKGRFVIGRVVEIKFNSKEKALELLGKHFGLLTEKVEITASDSLAEILLRARRPADEDEDD